MNLTLYISEYELTYALQGSSFQGEVVMSHERQIQVSVDTEKFNVNKLGPNLYGVYQK